MAKAQKYQIYFLLIFVMAAWGFNVIATKIIVQSFPPLTITSLRIFTSAICVFIILSFLKKLRIPTKREFGAIFFVCLFNVVAHHYFLSLGLFQTSATNGGLILGLGPLLSTIVAFIFLKSRITLVKMIGIIIGFTGVSFIVLAGKGGLSSISVGDFYVFLAILVQVISFVMIKKMSGTLESRLMTGYMLLIGSLLLFIISLVEEPGGLREIPHGPVSVWIIFFASAIIATALGHMIYNDAIGKVGVAESAIFVNLNPFFALVGAVMFLGETISASHILGFILILIGVLFGSGALEEFIHHSRKKKDHLFIKNAKQL